MSIIMPNVYSIIDRDDVEEIFKETIIVPSGRLEAFENKKQELEEAFKDFKGSSMEGILYIDKLYPNEAIVKSSCEEAHKQASGFIKKVYLPKVESGELLEEQAKKIFKYFDAAAYAHDIAKTTFRLEIIYDMVKLNEFDDEREMRFLKAHPIISFYLLRNIAPFKQLHYIILFHEEFYESHKAFYERTGMDVDFSNMGPVERFVNDELRKHGIVDEMTEISGDNIPLGARLMAIPDAHSSMIRRQKTEEQIIKALTEEEKEKPTEDGRYKRKEFDSKLVRIYLAMERKSA